MCRCVSFLMLVFSIMRRSVSSSSAVTHIVREGENITLHCNVSPGTEMVWYHHHHHKLTMIFSGHNLRLDKELAVDYNKTSRYSVSETLNLIILDVRRSDIGLYYCGARQDGSHMEFGPAVSLQLPDAVKYSSESAQCWTSLISVCSALALMFTLCLGVICKKALPSLSCMKCGKDAEMKEADVQYASLRHNVTPRDRQAPPTNHDVTYDTVARKVTGHPQV